MHREVVSLVDGQFLNAYGTFRIAGRVNDDSQCLYFLLGDDAKVHAYAAVRSERKDEIVPLMIGCVNVNIAVETDNRRVSRDLSWAIVKKTFLFCALIVLLAFIFVG